MAWLQNLAGHAENLLNKIDQNAATVLNDSHKHNENENEQNIFQSVLDLTNIIDKQKTNDMLKNDIIEENYDSEESIHGFNAENQIIDFPADENKVEKIKNDGSSISSTSVHNSFVDMQEIERLQTKVARLELENQEVNKQLLNVQHLYAEVRNENVNLQGQIERINEQLIQTQMEKEQYVIRAQRILSEKEKLLSLNQADVINEESRNIFGLYSEEMKKELEFLQNNVKELNDKNSKLLNDMQCLQMQHQVIQNGLSLSNQSLEQSLMLEKRNRTIAEEDCVQKSKELQIKCQEISQLQDSLRFKNDETARLKEILLKKSKLHDTDEYENRVKSLTQTLIFKQNALETITTERNALRLQFEKLQVEYDKRINELKNDKVRIINIQEFNDERHYVPQFMRVSPNDAGVTRRVKHAYSTLDALSIRTGIFLRRYPLARVFVLCYMVILHIWVLAVLFWYVPTNQ
ncbi:hypothetical protein GWI33_002857 [Rhynchophorus ferrugineus]|uniref:Golgin-84 n=1 Tax=Rhynchophorus ferrugineus TaxID=354439 RepID=A0A834MKZ5_RHYFE|nr:hypothetical protein GWI33_002857 [Rhynchophorus ferrugineus]